MKIDLQSKLLNVIVCFIAIFIVFHFVMVLLHAGPINPISLAVKDNVDRYIGRLFQQNWHLFAPQPLTNNYKLYVRVKYKSESSNNKVSKWHDVTTPMIQANDNNIFSPYNRMIRIGMGYINSVNIGDTDDLTLRLLKQKIENEEYDDSKINSMFEEKIKVHKEVLYRLASSYTKRYFDTSNIVSIQMMTSQTEAVPFSKRNDSEYKPQENFTLYEWRELIQDVVELP